MPIKTKVHSYLQKLRRKLANKPEDCYNESVMQLNLNRIQPTPVYTKKPTELYDWEKEDAKLRHPSNYRNRHIRRKGENK